MLSISHPMKGADVAVAYYLDERKEDYYLNGIDKKGRWFGGAAEGFGLLGHTVERRTFHNLLNGLSPDGRQELVQNAGNPDRQTCWDMTFNAPKPVSVLWGTSPPDIRRQIEQDVQDSVKATLAKAQEIGGITRSGAGGKIKEPAGLIWAMFPEGTSRAQDPHLHLHAVLINLGRRAGGTIGSIYTLNMFRWKMALGSIFQAELASRLGQRLGLHIEPEKIGFGIREVPKALCRAFSKRRQTIERTMNERGVSGALEAKTVAKETRPKKEEIPPERLFPHWRKIAMTFGWSPDQAMHLDRTGLARPLTAEQLDQRVRHVVQEMPAEKQTRSQLVRTAARVSFEQGADGHALFQSLTKLRTSDGRQVLWQPRWPDRNAVRDQSQKENQGQRQSRPNIQGAPKKQEAAAGRRSGAASQQPDQPSSAQSSSREPDHPPPSAPSRLTNHHDAKTAPDKRAPTVKSAAKQGGASERGHWQQSEQTRATGQQSARSEAAGRSENAQSTTGQPQPERAGQQSQEEQAQGAAQDHGRKTREGRGPARPRKESRQTRHGAQMPERKPFIRVEWKDLFPEDVRAWPAPIKIFAPAIVLGQRDPRWWSIRWKKDFKLFEVRVQDRILFRSAPKWSPVYGLTFPALRFTLSKSEWKDMKRSHPINPPDPTKEKSKDHGHSH